MSKTRLVTTTVVLEGRSRSEVARTYGVYRGWNSRLVARYTREGGAAFEPRPRTTPCRLPGATAPKRENPNPNYRFGLFRCPDTSQSAPEGIRTPNLLIRSQMLYPLSYGRRLQLFVADASQPRRRREDLNLRSPVRGTTH